MARAAKMAARREHTPMSDLNFARRIIQVVLGIGLVGIGVVFAIADTDQLVSVVLTMLVTGGLTLLLLTTLRRTLAGERVEPADIRRAKVQRARAALSDIGELLAELEQDVSQGYATVEELEGRIRHNQELATLTDEQVAAVSEQFLEAMAPDQRRGRRRDFIFFALGVVMTIGTTVMSIILTSD